MGDPQTDACDRTLDRPQENLQRLGEGVQETAVITSTLGGVYILPLML